MDSAAAQSFRNPPLPVGEQVYRVVREAIASLTMLPNEPITENTLAKQIGVSRTPIREALQRLEREGLVVIRPQRGTFVAPLDINAIRSAYFARLSLECAVAGEAARMRTAADIADLEAEVAAQRAITESLYTDTSGFFALNQRFHNRLVEVAELSGLLHLIDSASVLLGRVRVAHLAYADPYRLEPLIDQHEAIVAAVAAGDPPAAEAAMRANIQPLLPRLTLLREHRPDFFEQPRDPSRPLWAEPGQKRDWTSKTARPSALDDNLPARANDTEETK
jgi:DNA-binding GntR family transcriptional regulator